MQEMLIVGRGGEGVVLASQLLADALVRSGSWAQSFPEFKAERRGAPISAFLRLDDRPIHRRYRVRECDVLLVVSPRPPSADVLRLVRPGGLVLLNREPRFAHTGPFRIARTPASRIARERGVLSTEGRPLGNVALLGALVRLVAPAALPNLEEAIATRMGPAAAERNVAAAREGYARCTVQHALATDVALEDVWALTPPGPPHHETPLFPVSTADSVDVRTGSWSLERPVLTQACNACAVCVVFCPEGAIARTDGHVAIDDAHCKGCGICEVVCPVRGALEMEEVAA